MPFGHVACDLGEPLQTSFIVPQRGDNDLVPANYISGRVQVNDGVFLNALNKQPESFLALMQRLFRLSALRNILESNADEIVQQRKNLDSIDTLADPFITVGNFSQVSWLS